MGVDAQMFIRTRLTLNECEVRCLAYKLAEAVGGHHFIHEPLLPPDYDRHGRGCLRRIEIYSQDGQDIEPDPGETFIEVVLSGRFYGAGYERGNPFVYLAVAEWLERNVPDCAVWYGGDSSGICATLFDAAARKALIDHWASCGGEPYRRHFDESNHAPAPFRPVSKAYGRPMVRNGSGNAYAGFYCPASGERQEWRDGKWLAKGDQGPFGDRTSGDPWDGKVPLLGFGS